MSTDFHYLSNRWRMLLPEQQEYVLLCLKRAERDCRRYAERSRQRCSRPAPWGGMALKKSTIHMAHNGAVRIASDLLQAVGNCDDKRERIIAAKVCDQCGGHGRVMCECLPTEYDDISELVGRVDCELCCGDGDFACPHCCGSGAVVEVRK